MAKPRVQVNTQIQAPGFRPGASPVDAFTRPRGGNQLAQIAKGLSAIAPGLARYAQVTRTAEDEKSVQEAERQALEDIESLREAELTYREARSEGIISEHQDPIYRARYRELVGRHLGESAMTEWQMHRAENLVDATSLEEYDDEFNAFYEEWTEENLGEGRNEPALAAAYRQTIQSGLLQDKRNFSAQAGARMSQLADEEFFSGVYRGTLRRLTEGASVDDVAQFISDSTEAHQGMNGGTPGKRRRINQWAAQAALDAAETVAMSGDGPGEPLLILEALQEVPAGDGATLGSTSWGQEMIDESTGRILQNLTNRDRIEARKMNSELDDIVESATVRVFEDPTVPLTDAHRAINNLGLDHQTAQATIRSLETTRNVLLGNQNETDPSILRDLQLRIQSDPGSWMQHREAVNLALQGGDLSTGDAQNLFQMATATGRAMQTGGAYDDDAYDRIWRDFQGFYQRDMLGNITGDDRLKALDANAEFNRSWRNWYASKPDASIDEKEAYLLNLTERLRERYNLLPQSSGEAAPRNSLIGVDPSWYDGPVMDAETYSTLEAVIGGGYPVAELPPRQRDKMFDLMNRLELTPDDFDTVSELLLIQRQFFQTTPNNDEN